METFLVLEIDNVIDIEADLFWQCINAPHVRNDNTKLKCRSTAYDTNG